MSYLFYFSPLEQFEIIIYNFMVCSAEGIFFSSLQLLNILTLFILPMLSNKVIFLTSELTTAWSKFYKENISVLNYARYEKFFFIIFMSILIYNVLGLFPYTLTITSHIVVTLTLSYTVMLIFWIDSFKQFKIYFLNHLVPSGTPFLIVPFIIFIEIISHVSRIISLSVRLFANMTSGHALLKIFSNFSVLSVMSSSYLIKILFLNSFMIVLIVTALESLIAFLQAYVFIFLTSFYAFEYSSDSH